MANLEILPEVVHLRHPDGRLQGPMTREQLAHATAEGSISIFCWVYDHEKRASAPLKSFPELYKTHPESSARIAYFPKPVLLTLSYYTGFCSVIALSFCGFSSILGLAGLILLAAHALNSASVPKHYRSYRFIVSLLMNIIGLILGLMTLFVFFRNLFS